MTIKAHYDGRAIVPDEPLNLPIGLPITIDITQAVSKAAEPPDVARRSAALRRIAARGKKGANIPDEELRRERMYGDDGR